MSVKNRLKEFITYTGLTVSAWEKSINVSNGYVNGMVKGIGEDKILTILEVYPKLNFDWLMTGRGDMLINSEKKYDTEDLNKNIIKEEIDDCSAEYWKGRYDQLREDYGLLLEKIEKK